MVLLVLVYLGGVLTIVSPCILPVLPFVFARADMPFVRSGLPLLGGMAATFAAVATLAAVGGGWAVQANQYGRVLSIALLAAFGVALLFPGLGDRMMNPLVGLGARLSQSADRSAATGGSQVAASMLLGVATGLLWAPCAGPVLGLILTGAALQGANTRTTLLLLAYAAGAATSLALALLVGGRVLTALKHSLGISDWIRRGLGVAVLAAVGVFALGLDTGFLTRVSLASAGPLEQRLLDTFHPATDAAPQSTSSVVMTGGNAMMSANPAMGSGNSAMMMKAKAAGQVEDLTVEGTLPSLAGAVEWLNSPPLTPAGLSGKVVVVDFWTYSCINCLRAIPYVRAWAEKYKEHGVIVIGVHAPEFAFEKSIDNVRKAVSDLKIGYPIAMDNNYAIWRAFKNQYWPAHDFIDAKGQIRHHHFGEGGYDESERVIQQLLVEIGTPTVSTDLVSVNAAGVEAAPDLTEVQSPETYLGYERAEHFVSPGGAVRDTRHVYAAATPRLNEWGLAGDWTIGPEQARLNFQDGRIVYQFHARDLHLVLGPAPDNKPIRFRVTIDGATPGKSHGMDVDASGQGVVTRQRLYQLIRQSGQIVDHTFEIRFLDPGVYACLVTGNVGSLGNPESPGGSRGRARAPSACSRCVAREGDFRRRRSGRRVLLGALLFVQVTMRAHHSFAAEFDAKKSVTLTGIVAKIAWTNPHAHIHMDVKDEAGKMTSWDFELGSPNALMRRRWSGHTLKPGDVITVNGYLAKDGSPLANARSVTLSDGRKVFAGSSIESESTQ